MERRETSDLKSAIGIVGVILAFLAIVLPQFFEAGRDDTEPVVVSQPIEARETPVSVETTRRRLNKLRFEFIQIATPLRKSSSQHTTNGQAWAEVETGCDVSPTE